jgi:hypothetical protein
LAGGWALSLGSAAIAATLTPERTLTIEFYTTPPFVESLPNALYAFLGPVTRVAPYGRMTGTLLDGNTVLGVSTSTLGGAGTGLYALFPAPVTWKTALSPWDHPRGDPAVADFTSIHQGTIEGRIEIVIASGRLDLEAR